MQTKDPELVVVLGSDVVEGTHQPKAPLPALKPRNILVPFDFTETSFDVLRHVTTMAASVDATLHVVHVFEPTDDASDDTVSVIHANAEPLLRYWTRSIVGERVPCVTWIRSGTAVENIILMARTVGADLIVMASRNYAGLKHVFERSTADHVSRIAPCPVLTIPERVMSRVWNAHAPFTACKNILLPIDSFPTSHKAVRHAAHVARDSHGSLTLVSVIADESELDAGWTIDSPAQTARMLAAQIKSEFDVPVSSELVRWHGNSPVYPILLAAKRLDADLIVLPIRGAEWAKRFRLASVTDSVLRHASCPVLGVNENTPWQSV